MLSSKSFSCLHDIKDNVYVSTLLARLEEALKNTKDPNDPDTTKKPQLYTKVLNTCLNGITKEDLHQILISFDNLVEASNILSSAFIDYFNALSNLHAAEQQKMFVNCILYTPYDTKLRPDKETLIKKLTCFLGINNTEKSIDSPV